MQNGLTTRASLLAAAAAAALLAYAVPADARPAVGRRIGGGPRSDVHSVSDPGRPGHGVVKVIRPGVWEGNRLRVRSARSRTQYVKASVQATAKLAADKAFTARFGSIVAPEAESAADPTWLFRKMADGAPLSQLGADQQRTARREVRAAVKMARSIVGRGINPSAENFLFDASTGRITAWFSVLQQPKGPLVEGLVRTGEQPIGEGVNMVAYRATINGKPKIVKLMKFASDQREPAIASEEDLVEVTDALVTSTRTLRESPEIIRRFGADVIPLTESPAPGVVIVDEVKGVPFSSLDAAARERATNEVAELVTIARRLLPQHIIAGTKDPRLVGKLNFFFHPDGRVAGWFDHISDSKNHYTKDTR